ncbi:MAG: transcription elongation factor subunit Spt4 [archaeon]
MPKQKACKICNKIYETEEKCPRCESKESTEGFKGRVVVLNSEKSEIAQKLKIKDKGNFAIKTR